MLPETSSEISPVALTTLPSITSHPYLVSITLLLAYAVVKGIYNLYFSPLRAIPGPWYAAISNLWITYHVLRLEQCKTVHSLFEKYGPIVRVGPNKVVFNDFSSMRNVYSIHKFDKSPYYKSLLTNENDHAMTTLEHAPHALRRKGYAPHYTTTNLAKFQPEMHETTIDLVNALERQLSRSSVDCLSLFRQVMLDVVVSSSHGFRLGAISQFAARAEAGLSVALNDFPKRGILRSAVPTWAWDLICKIPIRRWRLLCDSDKIMADFVSERVSEMRTSMDSGKLNETEKVPLIHRLLNHRYAASVPMPEKDVISEAMGHMVAGSDTSSTTVSYLCWELSRRPDIVRKLQIELDEVMHDSKVLPDALVLQNLPYLNAFIKEGLRVYSAAPSLLERVVPSSDTKVDEMYNLMGFELPPGTIVATQAWSMHRNPEVFPMPDAFIPERWISNGEPGSAETLAVMSQYMMPFGTGTRICGGLNLAHMMIRNIMAAVVRNFEIVAPPETTEKSMDIKDSFVIFPSSMECKLVFTPRQH